MSKATASTQDQEKPARSGHACDRVFVVDKHNAPLMPCSPERARKLLRARRADVYRMHPFTIRLLDREQASSVLQDTELKVDPGSKTTGFALMVLGALRGWCCVAAWELSHRGHSIRNALLARAQLRRGRRSRKTRYRKPRFLNRAKPQGWLAPSLQSRVDNVTTFSRRLQQACPLSSLAVEQVRFDTQALQNPEIEGVQYQQGTLAGYEVREYLLEKWNRTCAYCQTKNVPLQIEHIVARSQGGTDRISNLCLACGSCNQKKANRSIHTFLARKTELLKRILRQAKAPLKDAAAVNITRKAIVTVLESQLGLPVITSTGGRTKFNRMSQGLPKTHWLDAACVGETGAEINISQIRHVTLIRARGRGSRQMCKPDCYGFPRATAKAVKRIYGFQTGDRVRLIQPCGKYQGIHEGVVSIRSTGRFDIRTAGGTKITSPYNRFERLSRFDGYAYRHKIVGCVASHGP